MANDTFFITERNSPFDWRVSQDDTLWANEASANNVCPVGYRLPTAREWEKEVDSWHTDNAHNFTTSEHALASTIKLPKSGFRMNVDGAGVYSAGFAGAYWSADAADATTSRRLGFNSSKIYSFNDRDVRANGFSVRCIKN